MKVGDANTAVLHTLGVRGEINAVVSEIGT